MPGVPDSICHWHFLADIGDDLLGDSYGRLRKSLREHSASTRLSSLAREAEKKSVPIESAIKDTEKLQVENSHILPGFSTLAKLKELPEKIISYLSHVKKEDISNRIL